MEGIRGGTTVVGRWGTVVSLLSILLLARLAPAVETTRFPWNVQLDYAYLVDGRDHRMYKTIEIDSMTWFAENLRYVTDSSWCYNNDTTHCRDYGRLYRPDNAAKACPKGWHLPSAAEWKRLVHFAGDGHIMTRLTATEGWPTHRVRSVAQKVYHWIVPVEESKKPKDTSFHPDPRPDDRFGFRILPAGMRILPQVQHKEPSVGYGEGAFVETDEMKAHPHFGGEFGLRGSFTYLWASTDIDTTILDPEDEDVGINILGVNPTLNVFGFSVRCVENPRPPVLTEGEARARAMSLAADRSPQRRPAPVPDSANDPSPAVSRPTDTVGGTP